MHIWEDIELRNVRKSEKGQKFAEAKIKKRTKKSVALEGQVLTSV